MTIESYNYNDEPSGRADTLAMALDKCERLERQLEIAVEALNWYDGLEDFLIGWELLTGQKKGTAKQALKQIKKQDNENIIFTYKGKSVDGLTYIEKKIEHERKELEK